MGIFTLSPSSSLLDQVAAHVMSWGPLFTKSYLTNGPVFTIGFIDSVLDESVYLFRQIKLYI